MIRHAPSIGIGIGLSLRGSGARFTGLLDSYPGAAAAYSLRALTSNWLAGDVVEVRRSSDSTTQGFTENQIVNGELEAFCGAGDGFVSTWYDQSGNGNDATQATTTAQPKIVSAGALVTGGIDFDGVDDFLGTTVNSTAFTGFYVSTYKGSGGAGVYAAGGGGSRHNMNDAGGAGVSAFTSGSTATTADGDTTLPHIGYVVYDSANPPNTRTSYNDEAISSTGAATSGNSIMTDLRIGGENTSSTLYFNTVIKELIVYQGDQSANRVGIIENINAGNLIYVNATPSSFDLTTETSQESGYAYTSVGASFKITTDASNLTANCTSNYLSANVANAKIGYRINGGAWANFGPVSTPGDGVASIAMPAGTNTIEFINGSQSKPASTILGTYMQNVIASSDATIFKSTSGANLANQLVVYGDSITAGGNSTNRPYEGYPIVLRDLISNPVTLEAWGFRALNDDCASAGAIDAFVAKIAAVSPSIVWLAIGTNDYGLDKQSAASFETMYGDLLADLVVALPDAKIYCASPIHRTNENANGFGDTLGAYRTAISNAVTTIADSDVTYVDTSAWLGDSDLDDGVHPTTAGHAIMASQIESVLNP